MEGDPVFQHCIELRKYERKMEDLVKLTFPLRRLRRKCFRDAILNRMPPKPSFPKLLKEKFVEISGKESEFARTTLCDIKGGLSKVIGRVFFLYGFSECPEHLLVYLSQIVEDYIKFLISSIKENASNGFVSMDSLKVALPQTGLNFHDLHNYYIQIRTKFHDRLIKDCKQLRKELKYNFHPELAPKKKKRGKNCKKRNAPRKSLKK